MNKFFKDKDLSIESSFFIILILISITFIPNILLFEINAQFENDSFSKIPLNINGIKCDMVEQSFFHIHTLLIIRDQNSTYTIPANIGIIPDNCLFWLHTHDNSGIIHVEAPRNSTFTLNDFLQIWNQFDNSSIVKDLLNENINADTSILFENNTNTTISNYKEIELTDNTVIAIDVQN